MLKEGGQAPSFAVKDIFNNEVSLSASGKYTYVSFHRFASCPFCVLRTRELIKAYSLFEENNLEIISIWPSSKSSMLKYVGTENSPFPMIADDKRDLFKKYHVIKSSGLSAFKLFAKPFLVYKALKGRYKNIDVDSNPTQLPAEFLISPKGEIVFAYYGKHFGDHVEIEYLMNVVKTCSSL